MTEPPQSAATRSTLNRLAAIAAAQDQMQRDVEKVRAQVAALLIIGVYTVGISALIYIVLRTANKGVAK